MFPNEDVQRWAGRTCLLLGGAFGMMGYHFANVRFLPLVAGFAILAGVCYNGRMASNPVRSVRDSGQHPAV
jgi:hypothetical protein